MTMSPTNSSSLELTISMPGLSSSPSLLSSVERLYGVRDLDINQVPVGEGGGGGGDDQEWVTGGMEDEEEITINGGPPRKKLRLSKEQSRLLEESFRQHHTLNPRQKEELASQLKLRPRQVEVWFQNRRARSKLKQTEMECEYLKRWFGSLTEQNKRLQREVEELRAMKVGPPTVMSPHCCEPLLASTLSMCPRCEGVTTATNKTGPARSVATTSVVVETAVVALLDNVKAQGSDRSNRRMIVD